MDKDLNEKYSEDNASDGVALSAEEEPKPSLLNEVLQLLAYILAIFVITFLILHFVGQRTEVSGSSMEDTLSDGDNLIVEKISYRFTDPKRFDIIIFPYKYSEEPTYYIKRIIGLPGETIYIDPDGNIFIDGELLEENYGLATILNPGRAATPITLGEDEYFVMGDNRNGSEDSRFNDVANIKREDIVGRAWVRIYPFDEICVLDHDYVGEHAR